MKASRKIPSIGVAVISAIVIAASGHAQGHPERLVGLDTERPVWIAASQVVEPDGVIKWSLPDLAQIDQSVAQRAFEQLRRFKSEFGSAEAHGLADLSYPPVGFCTDRVYPTMSYGRPPPNSLDGTLLVSEVAVTATVAEIIPGLSVMAGPMVMLRLSDTRQLTSRSPIPDYVLIPLQTMVVDGTVLCNRNTGMAYGPEVGERVVVIGSWVNGVVPQGHMTNGIIRSVAPDGSIEPLPWREIASLAELVVQIDRLEAQGLFVETANLARHHDSAEHREFARSLDSPSELGEGYCNVESLATSENGSWDVTFDCAEVEVAVER